MPDYVVDLLPKQALFIQAKERNILYSGCFRGGKTRGLCYAVLNRARHPKAKELLVRKTGTSLRGSTLMTLLQPEGDLPPVLPPGSYIHRKQEGIIEIKGGGIIQYFGLDMPEKKGSYSGTGVNIDEACDFTEDDFAYLLGRISIDHAEIPQQVRMACNPGPPSHPVAKMFGVNGRTPTLSNSRLIETNMFENVFLTPEYVRSQDEGLSGWRHERFVLGKWVGADGLIYDRFDPTIHVREFPDCHDWGRYIISVDEGTAHPFSAGRWWVDSDGRMHRDQEIHQRGLLTKSKVQAVLAMRVPGVELEAVVVDSAALGLCNDLRDAGLPVVAADKRSVSDGIARVYNRFPADLEGRARITVDPRCRAWLEEVQGYSWRKNQDGSFAEVPKKEGDDAMDDTRYAATYLDSPGVQVW